LNYSPTIYPLKDGKSLFVYHPEAIKDYRKKILIPFFVDNLYDNDTFKLNSNMFYKNVNRIAKLQLKNTITLVYPAYNVNVFEVVIKTISSVDSFMILIIIILVLIFIIPIFYFIIKFFVKFKFLKNKEY
jgi:hypothetical protein